ncbi:MAG: sigma-70 family RNA polymerase sigma factor [Phycisphaerae bacterium]
MNGVNRNSPRLSVKAGARHDTAVGILRSSDSGVGDLLPAYYDELRSMAATYLSRERLDHTLQPTALVHEAYLRLMGQRTVGWQTKTQFFAAAATVMRRILVDHARAQKSFKRGGDRKRSSLDETLAVFQKKAYDIVQLDEALTRLAEIDARKSRVVELRFFGGLTVQEVSSVLDVPVRTVERDWTFAKAWLRGELA